MTKSQTATLKKQSFILPGVKHAQKYQQGRLDGLCGVYAIINAIEVLTATKGPRRAVEPRDVMRAGVSHLVARKMLEEVINSGMTVFTQYRLTRAVIRTLRDDRGVSIKVNRPLANHWDAKRNRLFKCLDKSLEQGLPVIICLGNTLRHFSVIVGKTPSRYVLHDSACLKWISRDAIGMASGSDTHRHLIEPKSVIVVSLQES